LPSLRSRAHTHPLLLWLTPIAVGLCLLLFPTNVISGSIGAALALIVFAVCVRRPGIALITVTIFMPLQLMGFSILFGFHVPASILRPAGGLSELLALAILLAALGQLRDTRRPLDRIDIALLLYVAIVTVYLVVPHLFAPSAPTDWVTRLYAWRNDAGYPLLFFGARHAPITARAKHRFVNVLFYFGGVVALLGIYQEIEPTTWDHFVLVSSDVAGYEIIAVHLPAYLVIQAFEYLFFTSPLRVSSIFGSPFDMSDYLLIVVAIAAVRIRADQRSFLNYAVMGLSLGSIYFSGVRGDAVAAVAILVLVALPNARRPTEGRLRLIGVLCIGALLVIPSIGGSRLTGAQGGSASTSVHIHELEHGLSLIGQHPLGLGLGSEPSDRQTLVTTTGDTSENAVLQVTDELGLQGLLPWLAFMIFVLTALRRRAKEGDDLASIMGFALLAILLAGMTHHVFLTVPVPWTLWAGTGLALSTYQDAYRHYETVATNPGLPSLGVP
jgi:hypothetical protein